jgi:hypothetical protein
LVRNGIAIGIDDQFGHRIYYRNANNRNLWNACCCYSNQFMRRITLFFYVYGLRLQITGLLFRWRRQFSFDAG